jgi:acyl carrier protein
MTRDEIASKLRGIVAQALDRPLEEVVPEATLFHDLGGESIDLVELTYQTEHEFGIQVQVHELVRDDVFLHRSAETDRELTADELATLREKAPFLEVPEGPLKMSGLTRLYTVEALARFVEWKLAQRDAEA